MNGFAEGFPWDDRNEVANLFLASHTMQKGLTTLAHEIGHALGLWHTFRGTAEVRCGDECAEPAGFDEAGGDFVGDLCSDTPPMPKVWPSGSFCRYQRAKGPDCKQNTVKFSSDWPYNNVMSYGSCRSKFTPQQAARMKCYFDWVIGK